MDGASLFNPQFARCLRHDLGHQSSSAALKFNPLFLSAIKKRYDCAFQQVTGTDRLRVLLEEDDIPGGELEQAAGGIPVAGRQEQLAALPAVGAHAVPLGHV